MTTHDDLLARRGKTYFGKLTPEGQLWLTDAAAAIRSLQAQLEAERQKHDARDDAADQNPAVVDVAHRVPPEVGYLGQHISR